MLADKEMNVDNYSAGVVIDQDGDNICKYNNLEYDMVFLI